MFMALAFVLSMFIDSITVILFLAAITITQGKLLKFDPIPVIIAEIFCSNLGGSSTMCGDPPNIIIGTALHYTFTDFLFNTGVIAILSLVLMIFFFYLCFRKKLNTIIFQRRYCKNAITGQCDYQQTFFYHQLHYFSLCSCTAGDTWTDWIDSFHHWHNCRYRNLRNRREKGKTHFTSY